MCNAYGNRVPYSVYVEEFSQIRLPLRFPVAAPILEPHDDIRPTASRAHYADCAHAHAGLLEGSTDPAAINMSRPSHEREALKIRFLSNMKRIAAIITFLHSGVEGLEKTDFFRSEGVRADILRAVVVFLHASVEDFIRSQLPKPGKKFTFYSASDIRRALRRLNVDPASFADLFPPLTQMAKRRNYIVHHADLHDAQKEGVIPWGLADDWCLIQWLIAVLAFYSRLRRATGPTNMVEDRWGQNADRALVKNVELARALIEFSEVPPEQRQESIRIILEIAREIEETLEIEVEMFLGPDGEPIEGAV